MKRLVIWILFALSLLLSVQLAAAQAGLLTSVTQTVKLRAGPGTQWKLLGTLSSGTPFLLDGRDPTGSWARGISPDGTIGWVIGTSLAASVDQLAALPSIWVDTPFTLSAPAGGAAPAAPAQPAAPPAANAPADQGASQPAASQPVLANGIPIAVDNRVNLRGSPDTHGQVITTLTPGISLSVDGRDPSSQWVHGVTPNGSSGWVLARFIEITAAQVATLPVTNATGTIAPSVPLPATSDASNAAAAPAQSVSTGPVSGFSYGGQVAGFSDYTAGKMHQAGMSWVKRQLPYSPGQDPGSAVGLINDAHARGFRILLSIVGYPQDVNGGGYFDQYAGFVGAVAGEGADAIEIWNEMNIDRQWPSGSIDAGRYVQLLSKSYGAIKSSNPNTLVISGAPSPTGYFGGCSAAGCDDDAFIRGMAAAGAANYADCIGLHYNEGVVGPDQTSGDPRGNSGYYTRYFWGMVNTYSGAFGGRKPLCFTELGYLTPQGFPPLPGGFAWAQNVTVANQAAWLKRAVQLAGSSGKVRVLIVWNVDFTGYGDDPQGGYAMIRPDGGCPACDALAGG